MRKFLEVLAVIVICVVIAFGIISAFYVLDTTGECQRYRMANPDIEFNWSFSTACEFQLSDGTWLGTMEYENQEKFEIDFDD